jgi:hypothetical protein
MDVNDEATGEGLRERGQSKKGSSAKTVSANPLSFPRLSEAE